MKSPLPAQNKKGMNKLMNSSLEYEDYNNFLGVEGLWICRGIDIIAESQIGSKTTNKQQTKFVKVFVEQIIDPSKSRKSCCKNKNTSFTIYVKKRQYLFHVLFDDDLTFLSLTTNTLHQQPLDDIFDLLYAMKSAFLFEDGVTFSDSLCDLHHSYQLRSRPRVCMNNSFELNRLFSSEDDADDDDDDDDDDGNLEFCDGYLDASGHYNDYNESSPRYGSRTDIKCNTGTTNTLQTTLNLSSPSPSIPSLRNRKHHQNNNNHNNDNNKLLTLQSVYNNNNNNSHNNQNGLYLQSPTCSMKSISPSISGIVSVSSMRSDECKMEIDNKMDINLSLDYFILKKGWMTKLGSKFKTWRYRYFELWSNGLLNYFDTEMKLKKKGSLNIGDEVIGCDLYSKQNEENKENKHKQYGFMLTTHDRCWYFIVNKQKMRDEWFMLIHTITFAKIDLNTKFKTIKLRLEKLQFRWQSDLKNIQFDIDNALNDEYNIYQLQYDLKAAINICTKCKKEIAYFVGSDIYNIYSPKIELIADKIQGAASTVDTIIHSRNETPLNLKNGHKNKKYNKLKLLNGDTMESRMRSLSARNASNNNNNNKMKTDKHQRIGSGYLGIDENRMVLTGKIKIRLPSKKMICSKNALSKKIRILNVVIQERFFKINIDYKDNIAPLLWKFDEILCINDIKGIYFGKKKKGNIKLNDIQQYEITISHSSNRRVQFMFHNEQEAFLWFTTLKSLYKKWNV